MKKTEPRITRGLRLDVPAWDALQALIKIKPKRWIEKIIQREFDKHQRANIKA